MRVYIAGPMRGIKYFNFPAFDLAAKRLKKHFQWEVINPADLDRLTGFDPQTLPEDYDWNDLSACGFNLDDAIRRDIDAIMTCQGMVMLQGWENSKGACAERALAEWRGMDIHYLLAENLR